MKLNVLTIIIVIGILAMFNSAFGKSGYLFENFTIPSLSEDRNKNGTLDQGEDYNGNGTLDISTDISLYDYKGSIIIIDFFAYWCTNCEAVFPQVQEDLYEYYHQRAGNPANIPVEVMGISVQRATNLMTRDNIDHNTYTFLDRLPTVSFPIFMDYDLVAWNMVDSNYIPNLVVINGIPNDPNYKLWEVTYGEVGYEDPDEIRNFVDSIYPSYDPLLIFSINKMTYFPGDSINSSLNLRYFGELKGFDLYVALSVLDQIYFYPSWTNNLEANNLATEIGYNQDFDILKNITITKNIPEYTYYLLAICAESGTYNPVSDIEQINFEIKHEPEASMTCYFSDNPVYFNSNPGIEGWAFIVFIENTGSTNIQIDKMTIEYFDENKISTNLEDCTGNFAKWFTALGNSLPVGYKRQTTLRIRIDSDSGWVQFYFHGKGKNGAEVETTSEMLQLLPAL